MGAFQEYVGTCSTTGDVLLPDSLAFGNNDEPMKTFATAGAVMLVVPLSGQNLVPNGSFEEYSECPPYFGYSFLATGWGGPGGVGANSPDYFNACDVTNVVGIPSSQFGYQYASEGQAYMGMFTTSIGGVPHWRELIGAQLLEPLQTGVPVCLSFKTAVGGFGSFVGSSAAYTCKNFGIKFFVDPPTDWESYLFPNSAALRIEELPTDTALWYFLSDIYVPDSDYTHVVLGNFFADSLNEVTLLDSAGSGLDMAYAFVDEVRVSFSLSYCTAGIESTAFEPIRIWPQPVTNNLFISGASKFRGTVRYIIRNMQGQDVMNGMSTASNGTLSMPVDGLAKSTYILHLTDEHNETWTARFIHIGP